MNKTKKLLSLLTATALSASMFAGLTITASAVEANDDNQKVSVNYTANTWDTDATDDFTVTNSFGSGSDPKVGITKGSGMVFTPCYQNNDGILNARPSYATKFFKDSGVEKTYTGDIKVVAHIKFTSCTGKDAYEYIELINSSGQRIIGVGGEGQNGYALVGDTSSYTKIAETDSWSNTGDVRNADWTVTLDYNSGTGSISYTINTPKSEYKASTYASSTLTTKEVAGIRIGHGGKGNNNSANQITLKDYTIYQQEDNGNYAKYTVQYLCDGNSIKTADDSRQGAVGTTVELAADDKAEITDTQGNKYAFVSDDADKQTIKEDGTTVITATFKKLALYTSINVVSSSDPSKHFADQADVYEGYTYTYSYPRYITDSNKKVIYKCNETKWTKSETPTESDTTYTVNYSPYAGTAYFIEYEELSPSTAASTGENYSGGKATRAAANYEKLTAFTVSETGTYSITVAASARSSSASTFYVYKNEEEDAIFDGDVKGLTSGNVHTSGTKTTSVQLTAGDVIKISGDNGNTFIDYISVERTDMISGIVDIKDAEDGSGEYAQSSNVDEKIATPVSVSFAPTENTVYNNPTVKWTFTYTDNGVGKTTKKIYKSYEGFTAGSDPVQYGIVITGIDLNTVGAKGAAVLWNSDTAVEETIE